MLSFKPAFFFGVGGGVALFLNVCHVRVKSAFSLPSFTLIKKLFSSTSLSDIRVASSAYLRLLMLHSENLFPASDSSSLPFRMMYSVYICIQVK